MAHRYLSISQRFYRNDSLKRLVHCGCGRPTSTNNLRYTRDFVVHDISQIHNNQSRCFSHGIVEDFRRRSQYYSTSHQTPDYQIAYGFLHGQIPNSSQIICVQHFHLSVWNSKDESVVEKSVKALKSKMHVKTTEETSDSVVEGDKIITPLDTEKPKDVVVKKSLKERFIAEVKHYWNGFRLLFIDVKVCGKLLWRLLKGETLSRREHKQLVRTTADLIRLVPFSVFIIVPFAEFLLPFALKLFPNMLPSTFKDKAKEQEKLKKQLKAKLEMAKFLQDTIEESALQGMKKKDRAMAEEFSEFVTRIRSKGIQVSTEKILYFSKLFEDEITLDNLPREQLIALCRVLQLPPIGTDAILRFQLKMKLRYLKADDKRIQKEGVDSMNNWELQGACRARGMRALGVPETRLKFQLNQWLDLHLTQDIPTSLLLLSRALYLPETLSVTEQLTETISKLSDETTKETKIKVSEMYGEKVDNSEKLELIKQQQAAIDQEKKAQKEETETEKQKQIETEEAKKIMETEVLVDKAVDLEMPSAAELTDKAEVVSDETITTKDLSEIEEAIGEIAKERKFDIDKEELDDLKEDFAEYKEDLEDLKSVIVSQGGSEKDISESKAAKNLAKRVEKLIHQMDSTISNLHDKKDEMQTQIEVGEVKLKRSPEIKEDQEKRQKLISSLRAKKEGIISINELLLALKRIQKVPDDARLQKIVQVLDEDSDGNIDISHVLKVIELVGKENVKLDPKEMSKIIDVIKLENVFEEEEKLKEKTEKEREKNSTSETPVQKVQQEQS